MYQWKITEISLTHGPGCQTSRMEISTVIIIIIIIIIIILVNKKK